MEGVAKFSPPDGAPEGCRETPRGLDASSSADTGPLSGADGFEIVALHGGRPPGSAVFYRSWIGLPLHPEPRQADPPSVRSPTPWGLLELDCSLEVRILRLAGAFGFFLLVPVLGASAAPRPYTVDPALSRVTVLVGKAGLFKFAGHEHEVLAEAMRGEVVADPDHLEASSVVLTFPSSDLKVTGKGEPSEDVPKVQQTMRSAKVLDVARFPEVGFRSSAVTGRSVSAGVYELKLTGELTIHGTTKSLTLPVRVELAGDTLTATGTAALRHTDFGLTPISIAGVVKVRNELAVSFKVVASHRPDAK